MKDTNFKKCKSCKFFLSKCVQICNKVTDGFCVLYPNRYNIFDSNEYFCGQYVGAKKTKGGEK